MEKIGTSLTISENRNINKFNSFDIQIRGGNFNNESEYKKKNLQYITLSFSRKGNKGN